MQAWVCISVPCPCPLPLTPLVGWHQYCPLVCPPPAPGTFSWVRFGILHIPKEERILTLSIIPTLAVCLLAPQTYSPPSLCPQGLALMASPGLPPLTSRWVQPMGGASRRLEGRRRKTGAFLPLRAPCYALGLCQWLLPFMVTAPAG